MLIRASFLVISLFIVVFSCKKKTDSVKFHHEYAPLEKGVFIEYEVTQIKHDLQSGAPKTTVSKLKTVVGDTVIDNSGRIARKFHRYVFDNVIQEYKIKDLWTAIIDQERYELVEENQRKIKLVFAPTLTKEWDMNAFNSYEKTNLTYSLIHKPYSVGSFNFDSTVVIEEDFTFNLIQFRRKYEVYAKNVGLIKKHYQDYSINNFDSTKPIKGEEIFYKIIKFGKE